MNPCVYCFCCDSFHICSYADSLNYCSACEIKSDRFHCDPARLISSGSECTVCHDFRLNPHFFADQS